MLQGLKQTIEALESFSFTKEVNRVVNENKERLADLQAEQWGELSTDQNEERIQLLDNPEYGYGYTPFTKDLKTQYGVGLGRVTDRVTLFQTGQLYRNLFAEITAGEFTIKSTVPYFQELMIRTGDPTGLDEDKRRTFAETYVLPEIRELFKEKTGLTF